MVGRRKDAARSASIDRAPVSDPVRRSRTGSRRDEGIQPIPRPCDPHADATWPSDPVVVNAKQRPIVERQRQGTANDIELQQAATARCRSGGEQVPDTADISPDLRGESSRPFHQPA